MTSYWQPFTTAFQVVKLLSDLGVHSLSCRDKKVVIPVIPTSRECSIIFLAHCYQANLGRKASSAGDN